MKNFNIAKRYSDMEASKGSVNIIVNIKNVAKIWLEGKKLKKTEMKD